MSEFHIRIKRVNGSHGYVYVYDVSIGEVKVTDMCPYKAGRECIKEFRNKSG